MVIGNVLKCAVLESESKPIKINKWDSSAVKNALDDAARKVATMNFFFNRHIRDTLNL